AAARSVATRARRALLRAGRSRRGLARRVAARAAHVRHCDTRSRSCRGPRDNEAGARMNYLADVRTLTRKDLLLELRARDTFPAMLLFVVTVFVVFHFTLPANSSDLAASGLLWVAILFTALLGLGRAFVPEREQSTMDGLVLAPCDRSAIWLAKSLA